MKNVTSTLFKNAAETIAFLYKTRRTGINKNQISIVLSEETRLKDYQLIKDTSYNYPIDGNIIKIRKIINILKKSICKLINTASIVHISGLDLILVGPILSEFSKSKSHTQSNEFLDCMINIGMGKNEAKYCEISIRNGSTMVLITNSIAVKNKKQKSLLLNIEKDI